jgi:hypothetical protein
MLSRHCIEAVLLLSLRLFCWKLTMCNGVSRGSEACMGCRAPESGGTPMAGTRGTLLPQAPPAPLAQAPIPATSQV